MDVGLQRDPQAGMPQRVLHVRRVGTRGDQTGGEVVPQRVEGALIGPTSRPAPPPPHRGPALVMDWPAELVGEQQRDQSALGLPARVGSASGDVRQLDQGGRVGTDVPGEDGRDVVVQVHITDRTGLRRSEVEATVGDLVEPQLLHHVQFLPLRVDAPGAVLQAEDFPEPQSLTRTGPNGRSWSQALATSASESTAASPLSPRAFVATART